MLSFPEICVHSSIYLFKVEHSFEQNLKEKSLHTRKSTFFIFYGHKNIRTQYFPCFLNLSRRSSKCFGQEGSVIFLVHVLLFQRSFGKYIFVSQSQIAVFDSLGFQFGMLKLSFSNDKEKVDSY